MYLALHVKYPLLLSPFNEIDLPLKCFDESWKFEPHETSGSCVRPYRQTFMTKLIVAFHMFEKSPKKGCLSMTHVTDYLDVISLYVFFFFFCFLCFTRIQILWSHKSVASYKVPMFCGFLFWLDKVVYATIFYILLYRDWFGQYNVRWMGKILKNWEWSK